MKSAFAKGTTVQVSKSRAEIEALVTRYGATRFASGWRPDGAVIAFEADGRHVRFDLPLPNEEDPLFRQKRKRGGVPIPNTPQQRKDLCAAEHRRRWRALRLVIQAKLEAVDAGIATFEEEFLAHIVVPGGKTFAEWAVPQLREAYSRGVSMPPLLGAAP